MSNKTMFAVSVFVILASVWFVWRGAPLSIQAGTGKSVLASKCRAALGDCDADAFLKLIYTTESPESKDLSNHRQMFEDDCHKAIDEITIKPLGPKDVTTYELRGVRYRPTLPPRGKLEIAFESEPTSAVQGETTSFLVGQAKGRWWILTSEPDR